MILSILSMQFSGIKYTHIVVQKKKIHNKRNSVIQSYLVKAKKKTQNWNRQKRQKSKNKLKERLS